MVKLLYGVISHQGAYILHENMLRKLKRDVIRVFTAEDVIKIDALLIPGGESTTLIKFFDRLDLWDVLRNRIIDGMPVFGTCAGMIILAKDVAEASQKTLGVLDITVTRMGFGRQVDSFEAKLHSEFLGDKPLNGVFIRAPRIIRTGDNVEILVEYENEPVAVRSGQILSTSFHPELTDDTRFHARFIEMAEETKKKKCSNLNV
ncbi:MAG: pyridoxal 5'-phosphate synthase glutaminase subunit PdxT [bacterium]